MMFQQATSRLVVAIFGVALARAAPNAEQSSLGPGSLGNLSSTLKSSADAIDKTSNALLIAPTWPIPGVATVAEHTKSTKETTRSWSATVFGGLVSMYHTDINGMRAQVDAFFPTMINMTSQILEETNYTKIQKLVSELTQVFKYVQRDVARSVSHANTGYHGLSEMFQSMQNNSADLAGDLRTINKTFTAEQLCDSKMELQGLVKFSAGRIPCWRTNVHAYVLQMR